MLPKLFDSLMVVICANRCTSILIVHRQAVASLVRRERDSVREELGGGSNMKGSSFSELNRVLELRSLKDSTGHLNTNTMYCIKSKVSSVDGKQTVFAAVATPRGLLRGPTALASGNRIQRHGDQSYNTNADKTRTRCCSMMCWSFCNVSGYSPS